ncbi:hypothetical protein AgCh_020889 [Apium graveolens]
MARLQQTQRKRVGSVLRLPVDVVAAIAAEETHDSYTSTAAKDPDTASKEQSRHQELSMIYVDSIQDVFTDILKKSIM